MADDKKITDAEAIKRLIIMQLVSRGVKQGDIALALGVSPATVSLMFPKGVLDSVRKSCAQAS